MLLSFVLFGLMLVVPWLDYPKGQKATITTAIFIAAEVLFYVSIFILGKSFYNKFKNKLMFWKAKSNNSEIPTQSEKEEVN